MRSDNPPTFLARRSLGEGGAAATDKPESPPPTPRLRRAGQEAAEKPLRSRHEAFCRHFVLGGNATYAAIDAGYARKWANNQGYRLMRQPGLRSLRPTSAKAPAGQRQVCGGQARSTESFYTMANEKFFSSFFQPSIVGNQPVTGKAGADNDDTMMIQ